jgi:hypothetical protein
VALNLDNAGCGGAGRRRFYPYELRLHMYAGLVLRERHGSRHGGGSS